MMRQLLNLHKRLEMMAVSDILIRGMEMPKSCDVCPFVGTNDDLMSDDYRYLYCGFPYMGQFVTDYEATRHPDCPLVPLPEGHGRLGDLDALEVKLREEALQHTCIGDLNRMILGVGEVIDRIRMADTIVPAEGGKE